MSAQSWMECLVPGTGPGLGGLTGTLFNTYTTAKSMLPGTALYDLPRNWWTVGKKMRMVILAGVSNRVTGPDTFTPQVMMNSVAVTSTSATMNLTTTANTLSMVELVCEMTCSTVGVTTSATLWYQWFLRGLNVANAASLANGVANTGWAQFPVSSPAVGPGFDSTIANTIDFWVAQSVSNAGNGMQVRQYEVYASN